MKKKIIALCLIVALAATAVIGGTLAYFTDSEEATNTFSVGNVDVILEETSTDADGVPGEQGDNGFVYSNIVPNVTYAKNVTVGLAQTSMPAYVFVELKFAPASELWAVLGAAGLDTGKMDEYMLVNASDIVTDDANVVAYKHDMINNTYSLVYKCGEQNPGWTSESLFTGVKLPAEITQDHLVYLDGEDIELSVAAYAIQADGFTGATAEKDAARVVLDVKSDVAHVDNEFNWIENHPLLQEP